jgi:hypothetical protein
MTTTIRSLTERRMAMKINPNAPAHPLERDARGYLCTESDLERYYGMGALNGMNILTVIASQQLAALVGSVHEDQAITEQYSQDLAKEAVMLSKALINELNNEQ